MSMYHDDMYQRKLQVGNTLSRTRKGTREVYPWAIVREVITAAPAPDSSEYVAVLCEGVGELAGQSFIYRPYFTNNRNGQLHFGEKSPQAPIEIDCWIAEQIQARGWYRRVREFPTESV
jgi:hypothetical protein